MANILFLSIVYDLNKKDIYCDLVDSLLDNKHKVTVISSASSKVVEKENFRLIGFNNSITGKTNLIKKGLDTILIGRKFKSIIKKELNNEKFDLIIYATPPITLNLPVKYAKKKYNAKTYLMLKDIFPQNAIDLEMFKKSSIIYKYFRRKEKQLYDISDKIGCMSQGNVDYLLRHNPRISKNKVEIFCNAIKIDKNSNRENKLYRNETIFMFGGNLGKPQNISGLLNIVDRLKEYDKAKFLIVGKGAFDSLIKEYITANNPTNLIFKTYVPKEEYDQLLKNADVGLISLDPRFTIPNIPSKLPTYMNLHKPVLAITDCNTDLKDIIMSSKCGWWCEATKTEEIVGIIKKICENKDEQIERGLNGFKYLCEYYDVNINVKQLESFLRGKI